MSKKDPIKAIIKRFDEACKDRELTDRYQSFLKNDKLMVERYNNMIEDRMGMVEDFSKIEALIFSDLDSGRDTEDLLTRRKELKQMIDEMESAMNHLKEEIDYNKFLIERYKLIQDKQMLLWYGILKDIDHIKGSYAEFKSKYGDLHF